MVQCSSGVPPSGGPSSVLALEEVEPSRMLLIRNVTPGDGDDELFLLLSVSSDVESFILEKLQGSFFMIFCWQSCIQMLAW